MEQKVTQQYLQVRSNAVVAYWLPLNTSHRRFNLQQPQLTPYSGTVTNHVKRRITSALDLLLQQADAKATAAATPEREKKLSVNFTTLTIASQQNLEVREAYDKLLRPWLRYMKDKYALKNYVWKAEYQARGQVHYHIANDIYLDWKVVRWKWNQLQRKERLLDDFARKHGHFNPNGTDVHPARNINEALDYMAKEMCKENQNQIVTKGKIWDCSENLKQGRFSCEMNEENEAMIDDAVQFKFAQKIESDNCIIIKTKEPLRLLSPAQNSFYANYISSLIK